MNRFALRRLFGRLIFASLPLAAAGCSRAPLAVDEADLAGRREDLAAARDLARPADAKDAAMDLRDAMVDLHDAAPPDGQCSGDFAIPSCPTQSYVVLVPSHPADCDAACQSPLWGTCKEVQTSCGPGVECPPSCAIGRRPAGLVEAMVVGDNAVGRLLARQAYLEAASVPAFRTLARGLARLGAPQALVLGAERAARDEVRHARVVAGLAARRGSRPAALQITPSEPRDLEQLVTENAVEGMVREAFGALVATWQGRAAGDPSLRRVMARIARDETRHAELAFAIDHSLRPRLSETARRRVTEAQRDAARTLVAEVGTEPPAACVTEAGLPCAAQARKLAESFTAAIA